MTWSDKPSRREFGEAVIGGLAVSSFAPLFAQTRTSLIRGVRIGAQSYSFRDRTLDETVKAMASIGLNYCELWQGQVETQQMMGTAGRPSREDTRKWRLEVPLDTFKTIRQKFEAAGITLTAYNLSFQNDFTPAEFDRGFEMAKALGVNVITASSKVSTSPLVDPYAQKHGITVAFHNHSNIGPDEFATPESLTAALKGASKFIAMNLDIGHFTAAGFDPLPFLDEHHARIVSIHLKDRKKQQPNPAGGRPTGGDTVPFGEGDAQVAEVLRRLRDRKWDIPAQIEYEYRGQDTVTEVTRALDFCRKTLEA